MTAEKVLAARAAYSGKRGEIPALAREYGISAPAMSAILKGQHWKHLPTDGVVTEKASDPPTP